MDGLHCSGYESSLSDCPHNGFGQHDCGHYEDAGVLCGAREVIFVDSVYNFTSEGFPGNYSNSLSTRWHFSTHEGYNLLLRFDVLLTEFDFDYVRVGNGNITYEEVALTWSGGPAVDQVKVLSSGNTQWMTFDSDSSVVTGGFAGSVEVVNMNMSDLDCGDEFRCERDGVCIPQWRVCDFETNCASGSDETPCVGGTYHPPPVGTATAPPDWWNIPTVTLWGRHTRHSSSWR
ncbi:Deleted in malignant brain tumors 1 protein [Holothuria leucospilota]|uniref:Deleted in malignant brain tumors 1 protein n=1 Tax=Holothuria leucospilota TaxID=206669 RepID=A0A9Q0YLP4_HOLLE|nr:Deleted in malignant brain tumors 1 protein [Holothuria leucospilota]